jgi:hypothetical protein
MMMLRTVFLLAAVAAIAGTACGPKVRLDDPSPFDEDDPRAGDADDDFDVREEAPPTEGRARMGEVDRPTLHAVLDQGPGVFLRGVEISARIHNDRFTGWRVVQFMPNEHRFDAYDLVPGDVVMAVNGSQISRPNHLHDLWEQLRDAETIVVAVERDGAPFELRLDVRD